MNTYIRKKKQKEKFIFLGTISPLIRTHTYKNKLHGLEIEIDKTKSPTETTKQKQLMMSCSSVITVGHAADGSEVINRLGHKQQAF